MLNCFCRLLQKAHFLPNSKFALNLCCRLFPLSLLQVLRLSVWDCRTFYFFGNSAVTCRHQVALPRLLRCCSLYFHFGVLRVVRSCSFGGRILLWQCLPWLIRSDLRAASFLHRPHFPLRRCLRLMDHAAVTRRLNPCCRFRSCSW